MSNSYSWTIRKLESFESFNNLENAVSRVYWTVSGTDGTNTTAVEGTVDLDLPNPDNFTSYSGLTAEQVITWVKDKIGTVIENRYYEYLDQKLTELARPTNVIETTLPWA